MKRICFGVVVFVLVFHCFSSIVIGKTIIESENTDPALPEFPDDAEQEDHQRIAEGIKLEIMRDPYNYELYAKLAFVYDYIGDYESALEALESELKYMPEDYENKDIIYGNLARACLLTGRTDEAKPWLDEANKINPDNRFNRWHSLTYSILKGKYTVAASEMRKLAELDPSDRDHYYDAYRYAFDNIKDKKAVIVLFHKAVKENPESHQAHRALGVAIRNASLNNYEENMPTVIKELKKALRLDPTYIPTYISIADTYLLLAEKTGHRNQYTEALKWFNEAYKIDPENLRLIYAMGNLYYAMGKYEKAIEKLEYAYDNGLQDEPLTRILAMSYNNIAYDIYESGENLEEGLRLIGKAVILKPDDGIILGTKAELLYKLGKYETAHFYIKKALELEPDHEEMNQDLIKIKEALASYK